MTGTEPAVPRIDTSRPHPARVYDWFLGGKDNYPVDEELGRQITALQGDAPRHARENRRFMERATRAVVRETGIRQFLDVGSGIPTEPNLHQIAQSVVPDARVVYVDNDPMVLAHGRALLAENANTGVITSDLRDPAAILADPGVREFIDFDRPVGVMLVGILHHLHDDEDPKGIVEAYMEAVPPGSHLFITHFCDSSQEARDAEKKFLALLGTGRFRTPEEITAFFDGFELLEPGVVPLPLWRPDGPVPEHLTVGQRLMYGGIARKG